MKSKKLRGALNSSAAELERRVRESCTQSKTSSNNVGLEAVSNLSMTETVGPSHESVTMTNRTNLGPPPLAQPTKQGEKERKKG